MVEKEKNNRCPKDYLKIFTDDFLWTFVYSFAS